MSEEMHQMGLIAKMSIPKHYWIVERDGAWVIEGDATTRTPEQFAATPPDAGRGWVVMRIPNAKIEAVCNQLKL